MFHLHHCKTCNDYYKCDKRCRKPYTFSAKYRAPWAKCPACKREGR